LNILQIENNKVYIDVNYMLINMKVIDFFSGCGGLSLGFQNAGFSIVKSYDNWEKAVETYKQNFQDHPIEMVDLNELNNENHPELKFLKSLKPHIIMGGPPCQDFSSAGKRNGNGHRGNLTPLFAELVAKISPNWVIMENVNTIKTTGDGQLKKAKKILTDAGYGISTAVLNAADFGVPQNRKRFFLIGRKNGKDNEIIPHLNSQKRERKSVREHFIENNVDLNGTEHYYRHPRTYNRRGIFSIDEQSPTIRGVNRPIPKTYKPHKIDTEKNISKVRPLTSEERALIQTFPKDFSFIGNKTEVEQQIGNAVPPTLAFAIASAIKNFEN